MHTTDSSETKEDDIMEFWYPLISIFLLNMVSNSIGTLKTIFIAKKQLKPAYVVTFLDATVFAIALKQIADGEGIWFIFAFAAGKVVGVYIGDKIDRLLNLGFIEVELYLTDLDRVKALADDLRENGLSVNTAPVYGHLGHKRYLIQVTLPKRRGSLLNGILAKHEVTEPTMAVRELDKVTGHLAYR